MKLGLESLVPTKSINISYEQLCEMFSNMTTVSSAIDSIFEKIEIASKIKKIYTASSGISKATVRSVAIECFGPNTSIEGLAADFLAKIKKGIVWLIDKILKGAEWLITKLTDFIRWLRDKLNGTNRGSIEELEKKKQKAESYAAALSEELKRSDADAARIIEKYQSNTDELLNLIQRKDSFICELTDEVKSKCKELVYAYKKINELKLEIEQNKAAENEEIDVICSDIGQVRMLKDKIKMLFECVCSASSNAGEDTIDSCVSNATSSINSYNEFLKSIFEQKPKKHSLKECFSLCDTFLAIMTSCKDYANKIKEVINKQFNSFENEEVAKKITSCNKKILDAFMTTEQRVGVLLSNMKSQLADNYRQKQMKQ